MKKTYGYGHKFTKNHFNQPISNVTIADVKWRQTTGYNNADDIIDGRTSEVPPHPMGLIGKEMFEKGFFTGFKYAPGLDDYPPAEIKTG